MKFFLFPCSEDRIRNGAKKLAKGRHGATQGRLDSFFKVIPSAPSASKRKVCYVLHVFCSFLYSILLAREFINHKCSFSCMSDKTQMVDFQIVHILYHIPRIFLLYRLSLRQINCNPCCWK